MLQVGILQTVQVGTPKHYGCADTTKRMEHQWETSFFRSPSTQPRMLFTTHLEGNEQADKKNHGQLDQAVLLYAASHYPHWQQELKQPEIGPGGFGENFTVSGLSEENACIGDLYAIGEARIRVSGPRYPCWKIERRWDIKGLTDRVAQTGRTGWYCSTVQEGMVEPGLPILLIERPYPNLTMALINRLVHLPEKNEEDLEQVQALVRCTDLEGWWKDLILRSVQSPS